MDVTGLLQSKKRCLSRFLEISETFVFAAEAGDLSGLGRFEAQRDGVIRTLELLDRKITEQVNTLPSHARTDALRVSISDAMRDEARLVQSIFVVDRRIIRCIELEKARIQKEQAANRKSSDLTGRFRSTWMPEAGAEVDNKA